MKTNFLVHIFLDNKLMFTIRMAHLPRTGETMRFASGKYGIVTEVIWCMDEPVGDWQRVNIRTESEPTK